MAELGIEISHYYHDDIDSRVMGINSRKIWAMFSRI